MSLRERIERFRDEWRAAQEAIDRNERARKRRQAKQQQAQADEETVIHNTATIAGNVANSVVHHPHCG